MRTVAAVYEDLAPAVLGFFRSHRMRDAEDLTGDVFLRVTKALAKFDGDDVALRRWVFTIAHHRLIDEYRRAGRESKVAGARSGETRSAETIDTDTSGGDPALIAALATLTAEQREVLVLRFVADLAIEDVAKTVGNVSAP